MDSDKVHRSPAFGAVTFFFVFLPLKQVTIVYGCPCRVNRVDRHDQVVRLYLTGVQRSGGAVDPDVQVNK